MAKKARKTRATRTRKTAVTTGRARRAVTRTRAARTRKAKRLTAAATTSDQARTIVYVHGIGNKPEEAVLRCQWDHALLGFGLGERSRMAYWCQSDRHGPPESATCADADAVGAKAMHVGGFGARAIARAVEREQPLTTVVKDLTDDAKERAALTRLLNEMGGGGRIGIKGAKRATRVGAKGLGDIDFFDPLTRLLTALFLKDVNDFFFDAARRKAMKDRLRERLDAGNGPFVVVAHSQGTMIAWSLLQELGTAVDVAQFVTVGSPLGLAEVRAQLRRLHGLGPGTLPSPAGVREWVNVFDRKDVVAQHEKLSPHYTGAAVPVDNELPNSDGPSNAHSATGYLSLPFVQQQVRAAVDLQRFQRTAQFIMASDVTTDFERAPRGDRRPLLIELTDPVWAMNKLATMDEPAAGPMPESRAEMAERVVDLVERVTGLKESNIALGVQRLERYVSVRLTEPEAQRLSAQDELKRWASRCSTSRSSRCRPRRRTRPTAPRAAISSGQYSIRAARPIRISTHTRTSWRGGIAPSCRTRRCETARRPATARATAPTPMDTARTWPASSPGPSTSRARRADSPSCRASRRKPSCTSTRCSTTTAWATTRGSSRRSTTSPPSTRRPGRSRSPA